MSVALPPALPTGAPRLHTRRCARHTAREAAARCPACGEFFCRECIVEHDGKLLCSACLAKQTGATARRRERLAGIRRGLRTAGGILALWLTFYSIGSLLKKIPPDLHDGTVWRKIAEGPPR